LTLTITPHPSQYNLKRKIASLPPLSSEIFAEKVLTAQANTRLERERATFEKLCKPCNKVFLSENAFTNHVSSQKHRQNVATYQMNAIRAGGSSKALYASGEIGARDKEDNDGTGSVTSSTFSLGEPIGDDIIPAASPQLEPIAGIEVNAAALSVSSGGSTPTPSEAAIIQGSKEDGLSIDACLFCPYVSPTLTLNVSHMTKAHGLFIPEASYLVDLAGLITYLGQKLVLGNQCLYCNKIKGGLEGVRTHMQDKGHTMLGFETEDQQVELGQFYDFQSTYSDAGEESSSSDGADPSSLSKKLTPKAPEDEGWEAAAAADGEGDGEVWETDSDTSVDSLELGSVPIDRVYGDNRADRHRHHMQDGWHSHAHSHIYHDDFELHLPSGRSVGHRSLARYYKQNLRDYSLHDKSIRRIADTQYPRGEKPLDDDDDDDNDDNDEGGVGIAEDGEDALLNRRGRREEARALTHRGEAGMVGLTSAKRREVVRLEKRCQAEENRGRRRYEWGVNKQHNHQKHFRDPLLQ
jgi:pre-60S factor REI1